MSLEMMNLLILFMSLLIMELVIKIIIRLMMIRFRWLPRLILDKEKNIVAKSVT